MSQNWKKTDAVVVGAGVIGASLALELHARGAQVVLLERDTPLAQASSAAAGMLAVNDTKNPPALHPLAAFSDTLYPAFLERVERISGMSVPFQTQAVWQYATRESRQLLPERSIDPRQLAAALRAALANSSIRVVSQAEMYSSALAEARVIVHATGAYGPHTQPVKGQMLRVQVPAGVDLHEVHRGEEVYIVPRRFGPQAGTALIGATLEDAGFDTTTHPDDLAALHALACGLVPQLQGAAVVEAWAGLRPGTADHLPVLGRIGDTNEYVATGHFRNGILLAPATAAVLVDLIEGKQPAVDLAPFAIDRTALRSTPKR